MKTFYTKVVGVTHKNPDGKSREELIKKYCRSGMAVVLIHEPSNPYDKNAVGVWVQGQKDIVQIGYIKSEFSGDIVGHMNRGHRIEVKITEVTGGTREKETIGVNLYFKIDDK